MSEKNTQRNAKDVALELVDVYIKTFKSNTPNQMSEDAVANLYLKFYATVKIAENTPLNILKDYIPKGLEKVFK